MTEHCPNHYAVPTVTSWPRSAYKAAKAGVRGPPQANRPGRARWHRAARPPGQGRGRDTESLLEFTRRLTFSVLISNGDYHLKNWSLIYPDGRVPRLSPAYDLVSTAYYMETDRFEDLGLRFGGSRDFERVRLETFRRLGERLGARGNDLAEMAAVTVERILEQWPGYAELLDAAPRLQAAIDMSINSRSKTIRGTVA